MAAYCQGIVAYLAVAILLMSTSEARHPEITLRMLAKSPCQDHNTRLFTFLEHAKEEVCIFSRILSLYALSNLIPSLPSRHCWHRAVHMSRRLSSVFLRKILGSFWTQLRDNKVLLTITFACRVATYCSRILLRAMQNLCWRSKQLWTSIP